MSTITFSTARAGAPTIAQISKLVKIPDHICKLFLPGPTETIYELIGAKDGLGFSFAIADVIQSAAHFHRRMDESYTVVAGQLEVSVNGRTSILQPGDSVFVPRGAIHVAKSLTSEPARLLVPCVPGWIFEDFNLADGKEPTSEPVVAAAISPLPTINTGLYQRQTSMPGGTCYEVVGPKDDVNFRLAIIDLDGPHLLCCRDKEVTGYTAIQSQLKVSIGKQPHLLNPGEFLSIPKGVLHSVSSVDHPARFMQTFISV